MTTFVLEEVRKTFTTGEVTEEILKGVSLSLMDGEVTALVGPSGSGKSTLLTIAAGLQKATSGHILFEGMDLSKLSRDQIRELRANQFGFVFQSAQLVPFLSVKEQLLFMLEVSNSKLSTSKRKEEVARVLHLVEMDHRADFYPASLSGGEKQRVAIARAIIHQPKILFADEPTASLDSKRSIDVMTIIRDLTKALNISTLLVTHDEEMLSFADRMVKMVDGRVMETRAL